MRNLLGNSLLILLSLAVVVGLLEVGIRVYSSAFFPKMMELDPALGWRHARDQEKTFGNELGEPVVVRQNRFGHRGAERGPEKSPGVRRILAIGDSFTEAVQVGEDEMFTTLLERRVPNLEVLNAGVGGYGTVQQYLYLQSEGLQFQPDTVLLMFYKNDLKDNCLTYSPGFGPRPYAVMTGDEIEIRTELDWSAFNRLSLPMPFSETLNMNSYLYNFLNTRLYQRIFANRVGAIALADNKKANACGKRPIFFDVVSRMRDSVNAAGADFFVVFIPTVLEAERGTYELHGELLSFCETAGLKCLSLVDSLHAAIRDGQSPYFIEDIHWTAAGHQVAADQLYDFLGLGGAASAAPASSGP
jgi:lysophospholipase L1-like esterase